MTYEELKQYEAVRAVSLAFSALMQSKVIDREDEEDCPKCGQALDYGEENKSEYRRI